MLSRKWLSLGLSKDFNHEVSKISWILKILPEEKIDEAIKIIIVEANNDAENFENLILYARFIEMCSELIKCETFINNNRDNAINKAEWHSICMLRNLGCNQSIHEFLRKLDNLINKLNM